MELILREIADSVGGDVIGDDKTVITGINSLDEASCGEISFFSDPRYKDSVKKTEASALIVSKVTDLYQGPQVVVPNPTLTYTRVATLFASPIPRYPGISDQAVIHKSSRVGRNSSIYPLVYIGEEAIIGDDVVLFAGVFIGNRVKIGDRTVVYPNVTILQDCIIGNDVIIHPGTVIGSDGFGFVQDGSTSVKIPQMGIVQIDDQVELGANNCVDRAALGKTWIKRGVKTDNHVHVGHNVVIGEDTIVVAQVGISGSVHIGREVMIGGRAGFSDHLEIGDKAMIGGGSGVSQSVSPGDIVSGYPAMPHRLWLKTSGLIKRLPQFKDRLRALEKEVDELKRRLD
ncbi:MAG: UDP-3-O-(3-hydroxymyristoyl)glucosamine N-acyltransferase [Deltaproteobacteria bacterium]|nr:UDP-3-O-(3-hydroxymyristoyl)glucosamine N-acyltransferase [Deltaproteobacteria bacterium]